MAKKSKKLRVVELDGRTLEGGGQLLRNALCLAALTGIPLEISNIRGNRSGGGGLKAQHLACVNWLAHTCNAVVEGAERGSRTLAFDPMPGDGELSPAFKRQKLDDGRVVYICQLDIGTAGSTGLAMQAALPYVLFSTLPEPLPVHLTIRGGTNVSGSPSFEYIKYVLLPTLCKVGLPKITARLSERGWSHGGISIGHFTLEIPPWSAEYFPAFQHGPATSPGLSIPAPRTPTGLHAIFVAPYACHSHLEDVLKAAIEFHFGENVALNIECEDGQHPKRMYLILVADVPAQTTTAPQENHTYLLGRDWLYDRRISTHERAATEMAERVAKDLADEWYSGSWVDEHMQDQLVVFQALAQGRSRVYAGREVREDESASEEEVDREEDCDNVTLREPSLHVQTAEWVAKEMLRVKFDGAGGCEGYGLWRGRSPDKV